MVLVVYIQDLRYKVKLDVPSEHIVRQISAAYSISNEAALTAVINRGMDSIGKQIKDHAAEVTRKREAEKPDWGGD